MRSFYSVCVLLFCSFSQYTLAQKGITDIKLADLNVPVSPGFVLADQAPASIERPATPKAFAVSILNLLQGASFEVTPFWLSKNENLGYEDWIQQKFVPLETFNFSVATFKSDSTSSLTGGFRTQLFRSFSASQISFLKGKADAIREALFGGEDGTPDTALIQKLAAELQAMELKPILSVELAGAMLGSSPNNSFKGLSNQRSGFWCNVHYAPTQYRVAFTGLLRYSWFTSNAIKTNIDSAFLDYGLAANYDVNNISVAAELVSRKDRGANETYLRAAMNVNYRLNDNISFVAALGKNFGTNNNIITSLGIRLGTMELLQIR